MEKRIFTNDDWEQLSKTGAIIQFGYYHRYRLPNGSTPLFMQK